MLQVKESIIYTNCQHLLKPTVGSLFYTTRYMTSDPWSRVGAAKYRI